MIALLLTIMGALPEPRFTVEHITLTQGEMSWLTEHRIAYEQKAWQQVKTITKRIADAETEIAELEAERDALPTQPERDAIDAQIAKIRDGVIERGKVGIKRIYSDTRPSAADARRITVGGVYDGEGFQQGADANADGALSRQETGWPAFVFNALDANSDGALTTAEIQAYLSGL